MYEYHGWATIRDTPKNADEDNICKTVKIINELIQVHSSFFDAIDLRAVNGAYHLWIAGYRNHKPEGVDDPKIFIEKLAEIAPGSYGLLYVMDDEDPNGFNNEFQVFVLARGKLTKRNDTFLSPFIPVVEDQLQD